MPKAGHLDDQPDRSAIVNRLQQAFKLALSMALFYWLALWTNWDVPQYGGLAIVIVSLGTTGATLEKGIMRVLGTTIGVAIGFLILALFNHDRWSTLFAFSCYLTLIGYLMQPSRYSYAWYAAAFIPLVVWGDNYPRFDSAFYFGTFRYLQTTAGVLIYTIVDLVFWPRRAGDQLPQEGRSLWTGIGKLFEHDRRQLAGKEAAVAGTELRSQVARSLSQTVSILQQAYLDSAAVRNRKREWEVWRVKLRALETALDRWQASIEDCRGFDLARLVPRLDKDLDLLGKRFARIAGLWEEIHVTPLGSDVSNAVDGQLAEKVEVKIDSSAAAELPSENLAALTSFVDRLAGLDRVSREVLQTELVLADLEPNSSLTLSPAEQDQSRASRWNSAQFVRALFPPTAFLVAFLFWVFVNPPTGAKVPMFAGSIALVILRTPMNPLAVLVVMLVSVLFVVAPVYWFVMPALETGFELLALIFIYSFVFGFLGGRSPALKAGPMIMFVVSAGISNQQTYSFQGIVDGALLILLAGAIVTAVYYLFTAMRLDQTLPRILRRCWRLSA